MTGETDDGAARELGRYKAELLRLRAAAGDLRAEHTRTQRELERAQEAVARLEAELEASQEAYRRLRTRRGVRLALRSARVAARAKGGGGRVRAPEPQGAVRAVSSPAPPTSAVRQRLAAAAAGDRSLISLGVLGEQAAVAALRAAGWSAAAVSPREPRHDLDVLLVTDPALLGPDLPRGPAIVAWAADRSWRAHPWLGLADLVMTPAELRAQLDAHRPAVPVDAGALGGALRDWAAAVQFAVFIGTPDWGQADRWGDTFFGRAIQRALLGRGHPTRLYPRDEHLADHAGRADVALHVLGLSVPPPRPEQVNVLWVISHPELVTPQRCAAYDVVGVASRRFAAALTPRLDVPVVDLPQATDPEQFRPEPGGPPHELLFVGNSRRARRTIVDDLTPTSHDLAVYGAEWTADLVEPGLVRGEAVPNAELHRHYAAAAIVLNDHWPDMARQGFVSNRIYDASAAGAFVLSDHVDGIDHLFDGGVVTYRGRADLAAKVERFLTDPALRAAHAERARGAVLARHTFGHRVDRILELVDPVLAEARPAAGA